MSEQQGRRGDYQARPELAGVDVALYHAIVARRIQWDNLLWQVPVISLTGQAFLFTIALSAGNSVLARAISSVLALVASVLSMQLMSRHRQAEITDAHWQRAYEEANFGTSFVAEPWQRERDRHVVGFGFSRLPGYRTWMTGFSLFALAALLTLTVTLMDNTAF